MFAYIVRRLLLMIPTTLGITLVIFTVYRAAPGDPATVMMGIGSGGAMSEGADAAARADAFRREYGLDRSAVVQYLNYIGPFNLLRDGHPWFTSPYTERKVEEREFGDHTIRVGRPMKIDHLPTTDAARAESLDADVEVWVSGDGDTEAALARVVAAGPAGLPPLFSALDRAGRARGTVADARLARAAEALERIAGPRPELPAALGPEQIRDARVGQWFLWYYTEGGGSRVRNTGERPWGGLLVGDLGREMQTKRPVKDELATRLAVTVPLSLIAVMLSYLIALPLGIFSARRQGTVADGATTTTLFILYSIPQFWAGLMLILLFGATGLDLLPVVGLEHKDAATFDSWERFVDRIRHVILPIVCLSYAGLAYLSRQQRGGMLEVIRQDYIRTARAKGLAENVVVYKHVLRNSMIPVITLLASILPALIGGSIIVETVFDIPGMGRYAFEGLLRRDFYIVMATTTFVGIMTQIGILLSDVTYSIVDPRIRHT